MPYGDGTGPGWARGRWNCRGKMGFGRGSGAGYWRPGRDNVQDLESYAEMLKTELDQVKKRIAELK